MICDQSEFANAPQTKAVVEEEKPTGSTYTSSKVSGADQHDHQSVKSSASKLELSETESKPTPETMEQQPKRQSWDFIKPNFTEKQQVS